MAIDTEDKRRSACGSPMAALIPFPVPDNSVDVVDRPHAAWVYRGISFQPPPVAVDNAPLFGTNV